jgi:protein TonB
VAVNIIETEIAPVIVPENSGYTTSVPDDNYLPQNKISVLPRFNERDIRDRLQYPEIAKRSGIEGRVILELYINRSGRVTRVRVLKEDPEGRGFAESAVAAFTGLSCVPAQANGEAVAVRYRYPVRFQLR